MTGDGKRPCKADIAVRLRYDLTSGAVSEFELFRDIRDASASLPPLVHE